ncbi:MAG: GNAT family N-acetyltransferase [Xanthomonadaceae bacterium]|nr:GNAT family N-acetyltransferase [Xanthomonadaceae bacterium]
MHKLQPIRVAPVDAAVHQALLGLRIRPQQRGYVGAIADLLADAASCPGCEPVAILHGDTPVGYCRIDANARSVAGCDFGVPALGLRAFFIDAAWQGRGVGTQALAALIVDLAKRYRHARLLVLTVDSGNHSALRLYQRAGFVDSGALYHGGRSGPQRLLRRDLL